MDAVVFLHITSVLVGDVESGSIYTLFSPCDIWADRLD